jgi:multicomponent Na+:H+ antiporter subunit C
MAIAIYLMSFAVMLVGVYAVVAKKNIIKIIVGILVIDYAVNMLLVLTGYRTGGTAPILKGVATEQSLADLAASGVDPMPQAMVLTSIVIGLGIVALIVAMAIRLYEKYGTFDMNEIRRLRG